RSTGEVMGHAPSFGMAYAKAVLGAKQFMPEHSAALLTVNDHDKGAIVRIGRELVALGFTLHATGGTAAALERAGVPVALVHKAADGRSPSTAELVASGRVSLVINTPLGSRAYTDGQALRAAALRNRVMLVTTLTGASAMVEGLRELQRHRREDGELGLAVRSLQSYHEAESQG
ncbi:MAG: carbamoyl phosphate synthase large subunit, partial [Myxococcales bacterium]|nr:carbamoyl phosphate synthase large subunit [Myxococcales bacterium]